jgi:SAM-dependent methyltransferase
VSWTEHVAAWSRPPVDDVGYLPSSEMLAWSDGRLRRVIDEMRRTRYDGWRNHDGRWRDVMGLDELTDRDVLDFGCGVGVEALELALAGNRVALADISGDNLGLAARVRSLYPDVVPSPIDLYLVTDQPPYLDAPDGAFDVFYCNGVLHHVRWPRAIMERAHQLLRPDGEVRLMLYSDVGWRIATGTEPPDDVETDPSFERFVRFFDSVGTYADWYDRARLDSRFGDLFTVERFEYLTHDDRYLGAVLRRRDVGTNVDDPRRDRGTTSGSS